MFPADAAWEAFPVSGAENQTLQIRYCRSGIEAAELAPRLPGGLFAEQMNPQHSLHQFAPVVRTLWMRPGQD